MAAGILSTPGTQFGPFAELCQHSDCAGMRRIAETICRLCDKPIDFNNRFYNDHSYVHAVCLEDAIEADRSQT